MPSHLHADAIGPWPAGRKGEEKRFPNDLPRYRTRPPWLVFLARHFAPRNHERYLLQGSELPQEVWDRAFPPLTEEEEAHLEEMGVKRAIGEQVVDFKPVRTRPWWLAFLYRHLPLRDE